MFKLQVIVVLMVLLAACTLSQDASQAPPTTTPSSPTTQDTATGSVAPIPADGLPPPPPPQLLPPLPLPPLGLLAPIRERVRESGSIFGTLQRAVGGRLLQELSQK
ncbi:hypothetical protein L9F63_008666 [Diploptera punctata]|uniref:Uncharacterized protein n=1 Tax=Diploptera punctata TaxID=6984 RepID=A0AAD7Z548_DIPPU|nr:hypothetical protein L9F63_008666 [Diploptera punctata]